MIEPKATVRTKRRALLALGPRLGGIAVAIFAILAASCTKAGTQIGSQLDWVRVVHDKSILCAAMSDLANDEYKFRKREFGPIAERQDFWNWDVFPGGKSYEIIVAKLGNEQLLSRIVRYADYSSAYEYARRLHRNGADDVALRYLSLGMNRQGPLAIRIDSKGELYYSRQSYHSWGVYIPSYCLAKEICGREMAITDNGFPFCNKF